MIGQAILAWAMPVMVAFWFGHRWARDPADTPGVFFRHISIATLVAATVIFAGHLLWISALATTIGGGTNIAYWTAYWTVLTALFWLPVLITTYVVLALKRRKNSPHG